jgi:hypothetical protein
MRRIRKHLNKLERMKRDARSKLSESLGKINDGGEVSVDRLDQLLEMFAISPVGLDPKGIVWRLENVLDTFEGKVEEGIQRLVPSAQDVQIDNLANLLEVSLGLNSMFKIVRHFYLMGKKTGSQLAIVQLQMNLPMIMELAEAYHSSIEAFADGDPIGDGVGPMVAAGLVAGQELEEIAKDTVYGVSDIDGRQVLVVKAKGPGGNVGKPGEAVKKLVNRDREIVMIVTVDAGLKLEGERSGEVVAGSGAAIGGPGVERYKIEEIATESGIPLHAVVVKMSEKEALSGMTDDIKNAVKEAADLVSSTVRGLTESGGKVIVAGIGNTIGIA